MVSTRAELVITHPLYPRVKKANTGKTTRATLIAPHVEINGAFQK